MFQDNKIQLTKKYLPPLFILLLIIVYAVWNQPHKNYSNTKPNITIDSSNFINEFKTNSTLATEKYLNQVILVNGNITDRLTKSVVLNNEIVCTLD